MGRCGFILTEITFVVHNNMGRGSNERRPHHIVEHLPMRDRTKVGWLISILEDPFEIFPLQSVGKTLAQSVAASEEALYSNMGWWGVSRKYWTVEEEHHQAKISLLVGASFVLAQVALTQSVAIVQRIRQGIHNASGIPGEKSSILSWNADVHSYTGLSELLIIDACANYFKHQHEWPSDWDITDGTPFQQRTITIIRRLGLAPGDRADNLHTALQSLDISTDRIGLMGDKIQTWREHIAERLRELLSENDDVAGEANR